MGDRATLHTKRPRPASHVLAIIYFSFMVLACAVTGFALFNSGDNGYWLQLAMTALAIVALSGLGTRSKWARPYCSALLALPPLWALIGLGVIVTRVEQVNYVTLLPTFIVSVLILALFYRFTFGQPSREAFAS